MRARWSYDGLIGTLLPTAEYHQNRYARTLENRLASRPIWLDLGAGVRVHGGWKTASGTDLAGRARAVIGYDLVGDHLRRNDALTSAVVGTGEQLPFADETFDVVSANMVLEHLSDPVPVLKEISRVLQPGGCFVFVTPNRNNPAIRAASLLLAPKLRRAWARLTEQRADEHIFLTHYRANTRSVLARAAERCGLVVDELAAFYSYPMIRRPAIAVALECLWLRGLMWLAPHSLGSNLIGCFRKSGVRRPSFAGAVHLEGESNADVDTRATPRTHVERLPAD